MYLFCNIYFNGTLSISSLLCTYQVSCGHSWVAAKSLKISNTFIWIPADPTKVTTFYINFLIHLISILVFGTKTLTFIFQFSLLSCHVLLLLLFFCLYLGIPWFNQIYDLSDFLIIYDDQIMIFSYTEYQSPTV